jgi:hypothetical protein
MIRRWHERVQAAERRRYGSGLLGLVRRLIAGDTPAWSWSALGAAAVIRALVPRRLLAIAAAVAACWLLVCLLTMVALARLLV